MEDSTKNICPRCGQEGFEQMMKFIVSPFGAAFAVLVVIKLAILWAALSRRGEKQRIRQPVVQKLTDDNVVKNARLFAEMGDINARRFKRNHHLSWWVQALASVAVMILEGIVPGVVIRILTGLATIATNGNKFFGWSDSWKSARVSSQSLSDIIMDYDQGTYRPELPVEQRLQAFADELREINRRDRTSFQESVARQQLTNK